MMRSLFALLLTITAGPLCAMPFKCDKAQRLCEVQTKRMTIGDQIGVFTEDQQLVALGEVSEIRTSSRMVKILKRWGELYRSYSMEIISDESAKDPGKFYKILTPLPPLLWGANLGVYNFRLGAGFIAPNFEGTIRRWWRGNTFFLGRIHYVMGSGQATDNLGPAAGTLEVQVQSLGLSAGLSTLFAAHELFALRFEGDLGLSNSTVSLNGPYDEKQVLNHRISDGIGVYARGGASVVWRRDGLEPEVGFNLLRLHKTTSFGLFIGLGGAI